MKMKSIYFLMLCIVLVAGCKKDPTPQPGVYTSGVFVLNEGTFRSGNASVSFYDRETKTVTDDIYGLANGIGQGDVLQSMAIIGDKAYLVMNNSGKVFVVNADDFSVVSSLTGFSSPRYMLDLSAVSSSKAYVSDWVANEIKVVDLNSETITSVIHTGSGPEEMVMTSGKVFVANAGGFSVDSSIFVIDPVTNQVIDSILTPMGPSALRVDANGNLWALCLGNYGFSGAEVGGALVRINPSSHAVESAFHFATYEHPSRMDMNAAKTEIYFVNGGIYKMAITDATLPASALSSRYFYGIGIDPESNLIYGADPVDFSQKGKVFRFNPDGSLVDSFGVGYVPNGFLFR